MRKTVAEAMIYACAAGGKRLRPVLTLEFCRLCGGKTAAALPFACALEMIHFLFPGSRRPALHGRTAPCGGDVPPSTPQFGEDMALLAGDALLTRAFEIMLKKENRQGLPEGAALEAASVLADAAGIEGMVGGQVIDLQSEGREVGLEVLEELQRGKTAALLTAACEMGCLLAGGTAEQRQAARIYGENVGLGFQIIDDILDATSTPEELGKPVGGDQIHRKTTYVSLLGIEEAVRLARSGGPKEAVDVLQAFGSEAAELRGWRRSCCGGKNDAPREGGAISPAEQAEVKR